MSTQDKGAGNTGLGLKSQRILMGTKSLSDPPCFQSLAHELTGQVPRRFYGAREVEICYLIGLFQTSSFPAWNVFDACHLPVVNCFVKTCLYRLS